MDDILRFLGSPWFSIPSQLFMCYVWYKLGRRKEFLVATMVFREINNEVGEIRKVLTIKDAHIANLQQQLKEAQSAE